MKLTNPDLQSRLAAEYVLGTMKGGARRRFEEYMLDNRALREEVAKWEAHMTPLTEHVTPIAPPDRVWKKIAARTVDKIPVAQTQASTGVFGQQPSKSSTNTGFFGSLSFWRALGLGATSLATALLVTVFSGNMMTPPEPMMTAVLEDQGVARMIIEQPQSGMLMVKMVKPWKAAPDKSLQLWVMPENGPPRAIGIINQDGSTKIAMNEMDSMLTDGLAFAITKEPMGGSPTGQPTGMTLCKGVIAKMPPKKAKAQI